jgi:hypothetical protein
VSDVADDYDVPVMPSGGFSSITFLHDTALHLERAHLCGKPAFIYQFGDWDPSGAITIPLTIEKQLNHMCEQLGCEPPTFERVALTREHIAEHSLPTRPTKREGNTHAKTFEGDSVELDALPPSVLRDMVREVIERHVDLHQVTLLRADEARERAIIQRLVDQHAGYAPRDAIQRLADYYAEFEDDRGESK